MAKTFYLRLAGTNLSRNRRMYGPYCVASALMSGIFFINLNLVLNRSIANLSYGGTVQAMFTVGIVVMTIFTVGHMLYINSFLIKRRKKEFGLYGVLGMERRHVARVILWENSLLSAGALLLGLVGGAVFGRLVCMLLMQVLDSAEGSAFTLSWPALLLTVVIFLAIFVLTTFYNLNQVRLASPIDLIRGERQGEKKMRGALPMTIVGVVMLALAYYMAISVNIPAMALLQFWPAVILVIIATWLLFTGGSQFILERLRKNKRIYYKPRNFIAISGLTHRMKQNAAGLANICILSTMVMVTVSCCCALYFGQNSIVSRQNPNDLSFTLRVQDEDIQREIVEETEGLVHSLAGDYGVVVENVTTFRYFGQNLLFDKGKLVYHEEMAGPLYSMQTTMEQYYGTMFVPLEDFVRVTGSDIRLGAGEVLLLTEEDTYGLAEFPIRDGEAFTIRETISGTAFTQGKNAKRERCFYVVVPDMAAAEKLARSIDPSVGDIRLMSALRVDVDAENKAGMAYAEALREAFANIFRTRAKTDERFVDSAVEYRTDNIFQSRLDAYGMYGGLLFLGVFFAILFLTNTVLIIYFKQISEGYEDSVRFAILQKVGLSDKEVRSTINRQMLIVFLLPLVAALIHIAAASNMIRRMLATFLLMDFTLTLVCILITSAVFIVVYLGVYRLTARTYYRLVKW